MNNKIAIVTGGAKRIGKEIVKHLIQNKWRVVIHYNESEKEAKILQESLPKNASFIIQSDFSRSIDEKDFFKKTLNLTKGQIPELLINNASCFRNDTLTNVKVESFIEQLQINCINPMLLGREFAKHTKKGNVINILDFYAIENHTNFASHQISKAALLKATQQMALEFSSTTRVNGITLSFVMKNTNHDAKLFEKNIKTSLLNEAVSTGDISRTIDFILNTESLTGENIFLDCGRKVIT